MLKKKRVLLVGSHPDDIEIGCGGTMSKYRGRTDIVNSVIFAPCLEDPFNKGILQEYKTSMSSLGVYEAINHEYPRDILENSIQDIRDILHDFKTSFKPDIVFCNSMKDLHQDHRAVASACKTIFRDTATVICYENTRSMVHFTPNLYVVLSDEQLKDKLKLLNIYKTQTRRIYLTPEIVESIARYRGCQVSTLYAEAFEVWRMTDR